MTIALTELWSKGASEVRNAAISFVGKLDTDELLTGTPTVTATTGITIASASRNSTTMTIDGGTALASQAVTFRVSGGTAGSRYTITATCGTDAALPQTLIATVGVLVV